MVRTVRFVVALLLVVLLEIFRLSPSANSRRMQPLSHYNGHADAEAADVEAADASLMLKLSECLEQIKLKETFLMKEEKVYFNKHSQHLN